MTFEVFLRYRANEYLKTRQLEADKREVERRLTGSTDVFAPIRTPGRCQ